MRGNLEKFCYVWQRLFTFVMALQLVYIHHIIQFLHSCLKTVKMISLLGFQGVLVGKFSRSDRIVNFLWDLPKKCYFDIFKYLM